ncbi:accessory Sec system protein translocase subunit SecY2 [Leuconostoc palmae]|uniref:accessory Sec system protein translocase subunit SecY2 n=1 Tax=Leuconostoc palmae TaxID=501487 RepID=UPI001C7D88B5|nr:accessory Sec system protein translocase subunit SecY2 [Leuconostoc palmae]
MKEFLSRVYCSLIIVLVYEIGIHIVLPGTVVQAYLSKDFMKSVSLVTGGDLSHMSFFSLGLGPYMSGMIFWRVIQSLNQDRISKLTENTIFYYRTSLILSISIIQSLGLSMTMKSSISFVHSQLFNVILATMVYTTGSMFVLWLVEYNSQSGIGGPSLLILVGILSRIPGAAISFIKENLIVDPTINSIITFIVVLMGIVLMIGIISFILDSEYRIPVQRIMIRNELAAPTYIPIKLLPANAMPYMFGLTFLSLPQIIFPLLKSLIPSLKDSDISNLTSLNSIESIVTYLIILIILGYGFSFVNVNPTEISEDLQKSGDYIINVLPGNYTREYITKKLMMIATIGNLVTIILIGVPLMLSLIWSELSSFSYMFGSLLILNSTIVSVSDQAKALIQKDRYPSILPH